MDALKYKRLDTDREREMQRNWTEAATGGYTSRLPGLGAGGAEPGAIGDAGEDGAEAEGVETTVALVAEQKHLVGMT